MYQIHLKDILIYGKHGVYEQELLLSAPFIVNISVTLAATTPITQLDQSINYETLFQMLQVRFNKSYALLESIAADLANDIKSQFNVSSIEISIFKKNAMIPNLNGQVGITYHC
jgi:7,8-dihydroneopterin aldolase/epimerase/oxygenase